MIRFFIEEHFAQFLKTSDLCTGSSSAKIVAFLFWKESSQLSGKSRLCPSQRVLEVLCACGGSSECLAELRGHLLDSDKSTSPHTRFYKPGVSLAPLSASLGSHSVCLALWAPLLAHFIGPVTFFVFVRRSPNEGRRARFLLLPLSSNQPTPTLYESFQAGDVLVFHPPAPSGVAPQLLVDVGESADLIRPTLVPRWQCVDQLSDPALCPGTQNRHTAHAVPNGVASNVCPVFRPRFPRGTFGRQNGPTLPVKHKMVRRCHRQHLVNSKAVHRMPHRNQRGILQNGLPHVVPAKGHRPEVGVLKHNAEADGPLVF
mmetsp:Transcript_38585/g.75778  ORF Transcript_38585/g.75778 Transcript_38585/m.75778 type:complete len:315 (-) Transcript_38585:579-1523(-)